MRAGAYVVFAAAMQVILSFSASATGAPSVGPQASTEQIRAAHPDAGKATRLVFDERQDAKPATPMTVTIADDYLEIANGNTDTIYDFKLKRMLVIDRNAKSFTNTSLYAGVAFRVFERQNLKALSGVLAAAKTVTLPDNLKSFWAESQLGIIDASQPRPRIENQSATGGVLNFRFEGEQVVHFVPSKQTVPPAEKSRFTRALRYIVQIHPDILDHILASGRVPETLVYVRVAGPMKSTITLTLKSADAIGEAFPLPPDAIPEAMHIVPGDASGNALNSIVPQMLQAVAGKYGTGPLSVSGYQTAIGEAIRRGENFQALLTEFELMLQHGQQSVTCSAAPETPHCYGLREVADLARSDPRAQAYLQALQIEAQDRNRAIELRQGISRDDLKNAAALDIMLANALSQSQKRGDALSHFVDAIRANPYVAAFYKDFGDYFILDYRTDLAWLCFDLGRALPDANATRNFEPVDQLEQQLDARHSEFF